VKAICDFFGHVRQAFYKRQKRALRTFLEEQQIIAEVRHIRKKQPKVGSRKLLKDLQELGFEIGRDRLFDILRKHGMLIKRKRTGPRTTYSNHWLRKYTNLIKGVKLTGPNQVFVSDITYLRVAGGFVYLSLVTDAFSRKIVGCGMSRPLCA
jgi:putative transposase